MTTVTVDYVWQAIRDSERSEEFHFSAEQLLSRAKTARLAQLLSILPEAVETNPIAAAAMNLGHPA